MSEFKKKLNHIKGFVFDVDGVFTDGKIFILPDGKQMRNMNVKDGYAVHFATKKGYPIGIITGGKCESIRVRFEELGLTDIYIASKDKRADFATFLAKHNITANDVLYMGDDLPDLLVMKTAGLATCPHDAAKEIIEISHYVSDKRSGDGCVRDVIEQTLKLQGKWADTDAFVW
jgi:3-deoxy-D-manno-octulosonate 8-phosphate phosphatase (KDO 8-P phosphatase)